MAFVKVEISADERAWYPGLALVDTGFQGTGIEPDWFKRSAARPTRKTEMTGNWSVTEVQFYQAYFRFPDVKDLVMPSEASELNLNGKSPINVLAGIEILRYGSLFLPPPPEVGYLEFSEDKLRSWMSGGD